MTTLKSALIATAIGLGIATTADAQEVFVNADITTSTVWAPPATYNLQQQIYVKNGATLTIMPGTVIASTTDLGGSLAVTRGSKIEAVGEYDNPIIFTSKADVATWTAGDPKTGVWREEANEWGNLTIMGRGYISACDVAGNTAVPTPSNVSDMEGLVPAFAGDPNTRYGGGNDFDDSGSLAYVTFRYGGRVLGLGNELNGLSLGAVGSGTDIHHIEIMNNVDDGIEIWGGRVNLKYFSIWNIGDDSLDIDQGYRGLAQFGLIVQGYSLDASQGSGVGDNCCEIDGAEGADYQPLTTTVLKNLTVIGQPLDGDHATAWRDNARVQYQNCIFTDIGDEVVKFDNNGDHTCGVTGYGNGMTTWASLWTTDYDNYEALNAHGSIAGATFYPAQTSGKLCEIKDSVFYNNNGGSAYTEAITRGVFAASNNNVLNPGLSPLTLVDRAPVVVKGGKAMQQVVGLDPRPANDAVRSATFPANHYFFESARFRGAFRPGCNWLTGWSASDAFGFLRGDDAWVDVGGGNRGGTGNPELCGTDTFLSGATIDLANVNGSTAVVLVIGFGAVDPVPYLSGELLPSAQFGWLTFVFSTTTTGEYSFTLPSRTWNGPDILMQYIVVDPLAPDGIACFSNTIAENR